MKKINPKYIANILKPFTCGLLISSICLGSTFYASAAEHWVSGDPFRVAYSGVTFEIKNTVYTGILNSKRFARAGTSISANYSVPSAYMGVKPMLCYASNNAVAVDGTWSYNTSPSSMISVTVSAENVSSSTAYRSWGSGKIRFTPGNYLEYQAYESPELSNYSELEG